MHSGATLDRAAAGVFLIVAHFSYTEFVNSYHREPNYERAALVQPGLDGASTRRALQEVLRAITSLPPIEFEARQLRDSVRAVASELDIEPEPLLAAMGVAITGHANCPDLFGTMAALGKVPVTQRIHKAVRELMVVA